MRQKFHALKKPAIRSSWNKYNLFNLSRASPLSTRTLTLFQQKWKASTLSRHYHGEPIQEKKWQRLFRGSVRSVIPMDPTYLATHDGAEQGAGRGSGLQRQAENNRSIAPIPYLSMVYAPLERRLDTAIFRALFASSLRQARQMVIHGSVTVNGKKMRYPGYQLNPGDMFMVEPERVMHATGKPKDRLERRAGRKERAQAEKALGNTENEGAIEAETESGESTEVQETSTTQEGDSLSQGTEAMSADERKAKVKSLQDLVAQAKELLSAPTISLSAKRKQELRSFQRKVRATISRPNSNLAADLKVQLAEINSRIAPEIKTPLSKSAQTVDGLPELTSPALREELRDLSPLQLKTFKEALLDAQDNPIDLTKPYATPWQPRDYMSAFAFIPRYLEVHPKICAAVYIRHPVARPGLAEVPSPFNNEMLTLSHSWYLRRR